SVENLDVVKYLGEYRFECAWAAMIKAARAGHIYILQWHHEHGSMCIPYAEGQAASYVKLSSVKWLHVNRA
ncbi:hypothetical protein PHYSODRAFT_468112, partial [Phytophthora sojae]